MLRDLGDSEKKTINADGRHARTKTIIIFAVSFLLIVITIGLFYSTPSTLRLIYVDGEAVYVFNNMFVKKIVVCIFMLMLDFYFLVLLTIHIMIKRAKRR